MTRMTGPDCVVMCNLINTHTHTHTHTLMILITIYILLQEVPSLFNISLIVHVTVVERRGEWQGSGVQIVYIVFLLMVQNYMALS